MDNTTRDRKILYEARGVAQSLLEEEVKIELQNNENSLGNMREIIIKNAKRTVIVGLGGLTCGLISHYVGFSKPLIARDVPFLLFEAGAVAGLNIPIDYIFEKSWSRALQKSPGTFIGFALGYSLGNIAGTYLK